MKIPKTYWTVPRLTWVGQYPKVKPFRIYWSKRWLRWQLELLNMCATFATGKSRQPAYQHSASLVWIGLFVSNSTFSINRLYRAIIIWNIILCRAERWKQLNIWTAIAALQCKMHFQFPISFTSHTYINIWFHLFRTPATFVSTPAAFHIVLWSSL